MNWTPPSEEPETTRMPSRVSTEAGLADITDSSERIEFDDILLWLQDEPTTVQPQDATPPPQQPETTRMPPRPLTRAESDSFINSSGGINANDILVWQGHEPIIFETTPPQQPETTRTPRPLTPAELDLFTDSSGAINVNDILVWQGFELIIFETTPPQQPETTRRPPRALSRPELDAFTDSSRRTDYDAYLLSYPSKGLSEETISKYLKTSSADEIRAHDKDGDWKICAVCLDDVCGQKDKVAILDDCGHEFHYCCLEKWLRRKNICPLCRRTAIFP